MEKQAKTPKPKVGWLNFSKWPLKRWVGVILFSIIAVTVLVQLEKIGEDVPADKIMINQVPLTGTLEYWTEPGFQFQKFGQIVQYDKTFQTWFSNRKDEGGNVDESIKIVFNDAGIGWISGSGRVVMPTSPKYLKRIRTDYTSMDELISSLIKPTIRKVIFSSGPLMSSYESYAAKKNLLIQYIEDQLEYGVYATNIKEDSIKNPITGQKEVAKVAKLIGDPKAPGGYVRSEESPFAYYGLRVKPVTVSDIKYEEKILNQIATQQEALMAVQTAKAKALEAQQEAIRAEEAGKAEAAKAKWAQEVVKAKFVTEAEQKRDVAKLAMEAAEFTKQEQIKLGQGEAERKRLVMQADGALKQKLDTFEKVQSVWADAWKTNGAPIVPTVNSGGTGGSGDGSGSLQSFINLWNMKLAKDLSLDPSIKK